MDARGRARGALALNVDLAPTIAEATGTAHPPVEGSSLLPLLRDPTSTWRRDFLVEHLEGTNPVPTYCAVRSERWKYVRYSTDEGELCVPAPPGYADDSSTTVPLALLALAVLVAFEVRAGRRRSGRARVAR